MATRLKDVDFAYASPLPARVRVAFQSPPTLVAVRSAIGTLPESVQGATLDDLAAADPQAALIWQLQTKAEALIATAGALLSHRMYRGFLKWAEAASASVTLCDDDECERRSSSSASAVSEIANIDTMNEHDFYLKVYLSAIEMTDSCAFGPLVVDSTLTYMIDSMAHGLQADLRFSSPLIEMIDETSELAWTASGSKFGYAHAVGAALTDVFRQARARRDPLRLDGIDPYMRGPLIRWQAAYTRYEAAADELAVFDRDIHTPAADHCTAVAKKVDEDLADAADMLAADDALDLAQERYDELCSARYDALSELLTCPAPHAAALAIKLRLFSSDYGWTGGEEQRMAGEQMTIDARRFGRLGALTQSDQKLIDAFDAYRGSYGDLCALPDAAPVSEEDSCFARMDEVSDPLCTDRAVTVEGVIAKLRYGFHGLDHDDWMPDAVLDPGSDRFKAGLPMADLSKRVVWSAVEDLARIAGVSLTDRPA